MKSTGLKSTGTQSKGSWLIIGASAIMVSLSLGLAIRIPAAEAGKSAGETLIDGDFEEATLKHFEKRFFSRIGASEEQQSTLAAIFLKQMQKTRSQRETIRHKMIDFTDFVSADTSTDDQIREKMQELRSLHEKLMDSRIDTALKVRQVLTPEQRKTIADRVSNLLTGNSPMR